MNGLRSCLFFFVFVWSVSVLVLQLDERDGAVLGVDANAVGLLGVASPDHPLWARLALLGAGVGGDDAGGEAAGDVVLADCLGQPLQGGGPEGLPVGVVAEVDVLGRAGEPQLAHEGDAPVEVEADGEGLDEDVEDRQPAVLGLDLGLVPEVVHVVERGRLVVGGDSGLADVLLATVVLGGGGGHHDCGGRAHTACITAGVGGGASGSGVGSRLGTGTTRSAGGGGIVVAPDELCGLGVLVVRDHGGHLDGDDHRGSLGHRLGSDLGDLARRLGGRGGHLDGGDLGGCSGSRGALNQGGEDLVIRDTSEGGSGDEVGDGGHLLWAGCGRDG